MCVFFEEVSEEFSVPYNEGSIDDCLDDVVLCVIEAVLSCVVDSVSLSGVFTRVSAKNRSRPMR